MVREYFKGQAVGFLQFMREQGVMGLALGFILGTAVSKVVVSFSSDIINPVLGVVLGSTDSIDKLSVGPIRIGSFIGNVLGFMVIAAVVYLLFKMLGLDKLDVKRL